MANDSYVMIAKVIVLLFICYRVTPGLFRPTSVVFRRDTGALPVCRSLTVAYNHFTGFHREYTVANLSITGSACDKYFCRE